ncbi:MAG: hypothetical protein AAF581_02025 [Planctomycetota bacterium]
MSRSILLTVAVAMNLWFSSACAQVNPTTYELAAPSVFSTGCHGPSTCHCFVQVVGSVQGTFQLLELSSPLAPVRDFAVDSIQWSILSSTAPLVTAVTGSGTYQIDVTTGMHQMTVNLVINGISQQFTTTSNVAGGANIGTALTVDIFSQLNDCVYDGFLIEATPASPLEFTRGDCNSDAIFNIADAVFLLAFLFPQGALPTLDCMDACDANDDASLNVADAIAILSTLFAQGPPPVLPAPFPGCGPDPTADALDCLAPTSVCTTP